MTDTKNLGKGLALTLVLLSLGGLIRGTALAQRTPARPAQRFPNILVVTIDTLRADRLSAHGYQRRTTPHLDQLLAPGARLHPARAARVAAYGYQRRPTPNRDKLPAAGARFTQARTVEPLTNPSLCSMWN